MKASSPVGPLPNHRPFDLRETASTLPLSSVFTDRKPVYLNEFHLYVAHFNAIPNFIHEVNINCRKASRWFFETYREEIRELYYDKCYFEGRNKSEYDDLFYFMYEDLLVNFDTGQSKVRFLFRITPVERIEAIIGGIRKFRASRSRTRPEIRLLYASHFGLDTKPMPVNRPRLDIGENYNDDFAGVHDLILSRLSRRNDRGIVLLHGKPGTGKTFYIRYLISRLRKNVIFLPPSLAGSVTSPELVSVLIDNPNSVIVIEDAEHIVIDRENNGHSPVNTLLNVSDGLLSDFLNIQLICSFNTRLSNVDRALLRKGRLIASYEFRELAAEKAGRLSRRLGFDAPVTGPMALTDIYNQGEPAFGSQPERKSIGFGRAS